jgi:hypothetical protein
VLNADDFEFEAADDCVLAELDEVVEAALVLLGDEVGVELAVLLVPLIAIGVAVAMAPTPISEAPVGACHHSTTNFSIQ